MAAPVAAAEKSQGASADGDDDDEAGGKKSKAQRRREKKAQEAKDRERRILEAEPEAGTTKHEVWEGEGVGCLIAGPHFAEAALTLAAPLLLTGGASSNHRERGKAQAQVAVYSSRWQLVQLGLT